MNSHLLLFLPPSIYTVCLKAFLPYKHLYIWNSASQWNLPFRKGFISNQVCTGIYMYFEKLCERQNLLSYCEVCGWSPPLKSIRVLPLVSVRSAFLYKSQSSVFAELWLLGGLTLLTNRLFCCCFSLISRLRCSCPKNHKGPLLQ